MTFEDKMAQIWKTKVDIPEWKLEMSRRFISRTIFGDGFSEESRRQSKEMKAKEDKENVVEKTLVNKIKCIRPVLRRIKTVRGDITIG